MITKNGVVGFLFHYFHRPLTALSAVALLVVASSRLAFAIIAAINLVVVHLLTVLIAEPLKRARLYKQSEHEIWLFPRKNRKCVYLFLVNFVGCLFFFAYYCIAPLLAQETIFITLFVPMFAYSEAIGEKYSNFPLSHAIKSCFFESLYLGILTAVIALIREPLGYATLSLPGGNGGIIELFNKEGAFPFAIEIISLSSGAFLLIGFIMVVFRILDRRKKERI
jgi:hypothetical protein